MLSHKPWTREGGARLILGLITTICLGALLASLLEQFTGWLSPNERQIYKMLLAALLYQGLALVWIGLFFRDHGVSWRRAFGLQNGGWRRAILIGLVGGVCVLPVARLLLSVSAWLLGELHLMPELQSSVRVMQESVAQRNASETLLLPLQLTWAILAVTVVPIAEETLFRGILYPAMKQRGHPQFALWASAILFAEIHFNLATVLPLTCLALVFTWLYEETDNLLSPIIAHAIFNGANVLFLLFEKEIGRLLRLAP